MVRSRCSPFSLQPMCHFCKCRILRNYQKTDGSQITRKVRNFFALSRLDSMGANFFANSGPGDHVLNSFLRSARFQLRRKAIGGTFLINEVPPNSPSCSRDQSFCPLVQNGLDCGTGILLTIHETGGWGSPRNSGWR